MFIKNQIFCLFFSCFIVIPPTIHSMDVAEAPASEEVIESTTKTLDQKLDLIAITQGYGYKAANLVILNDISADLNNKVNLTYKTAVPEFILISSKNIQQFFSDTVNINIAEEWNTIIRQSFESDLLKKLTFHQQQFPKGFLEQCTALENKIKSAITEYVQTINEKADLNELFNVWDNTDQSINTDIDQLIEVVVNNNEYLMVRSSGREDTKTLANAGGNASVANVMPDITNILNAIAIVVSSYFSEKSLVQRLGAKDPSLFDPIPFTPVIIQRMIHAQEGIPTRCGVMFTEETEGGIAKQNNQNPDGSIATTGITIIQAAYGHNEGVVNSLIPVDTYYDDRNNNIFTVIRSKTHRMDPTQESGVLVSEKNSPEIVNIPSLNKAMVTSLKVLATELENVYKGSMDVEFVINENEQKIYIVQARPLVHDPNIPQASYITNPDDFKGYPFLTGSAIGVAGGVLRYCSNPDDIIVTNIINQALLEYQNSNGQRKKQIQSIIIGTMAPITSHEATAFRSESKPVLCIQQWQAIKEWLKNPAINILISPQQGLVINLGNQKTSIAELIQEKSASIGWVNYPIEPYLSLNHEFDPELQLDDESIKNLVAHIDINELEKIREQLPPNRPWKEIVQTIKTGSEQEAHVALADLLYEIRTIIETKSRNMELDEDLLHKTKTLQSYLLYCAQCITQVLQFSPIDIRYTQRLFAIRFLEALLYQQPLLHEIVDGYSVTTVVAKELVVEQQIIQEAKAINLPLDPLSVQLMKIKSFAMVPGLEDHWQSFIKQLARPENDEIKKAFAGLVKQLATLNVLPLWLNTAFAEKIPKIQLFLAEKVPTTQASTTEYVTLLTQALVGEYVTQKNFLAEIAEKKEIITALNIQSFAKPETFNTQWEFFNKNLLNYFLSEKFLEQFKNANALGKLTALNFMAQFVDIFDISIKAVTGSTSYANNEEKVTNFKTLLVDYKNLFEQWITLVPQGIIADNPIAISNRLTVINRVLQKKDIDAEQALKMTPDFNVEMYTIGNGVTLLKGQPPKTYEDIFTLIHQCLLVTISALNRINDLIKNIVLPSSLANLSQMLLKIEFDKTHMMYTGIHITPTKIRLAYNMTLRSHSLQASIEQKKNHTEALLTINFYGLNEDKRWDKVAALATLIASEFFTTVTNTTVTETSCSITLSATENTNFSQLGIFITDIAHYVTGPNFNTDPTYLKNYIPIIEQNKGLIQNQQLRNLITKEVQLIPKEVNVSHEEPISSSNLEQPVPSENSEQQSVEPVILEQPIAQGMNTEPEVIVESNSGIVTNIIQGITTFVNNIINTVKNVISWATNLVSGWFRR